MRRYWSALIGAFLATALQSPTVFAQPIQNKNQKAAAQIAQGKSRSPAPAVIGMKIDSSRDGGLRPRSLVYPSDARAPQSERIALNPITAGYARRGGCNPADLALSIRFSDYTIDQNGAVQRDGGWTASERELFSGFLCNMMPIIESLYGAPFESYTLTLVRDLYNTSSSVFVPRERSIHTLPSWNPQLLTHELVHAFRGDWALTTANNSSRYSPKLSGYEEGFAQAVSYEAMNLYLDTFGADQFVGQRWNRVWAPESEWNYDFKNDSSMVTEDFWSDVGGTRKYFERYEQAAAAMQQLAIKIPSFYQRFNQAYYQAIRSTPGYLPTKERIDSIIQSLTDEAVADWISKQNILQCRVNTGKKIWLTAAPGNPLEPLQKIHFIETFPAGSEWYYTVPGQGYLLHRLNGSAGSLDLVRSWDRSTVVANQNVLMRGDPRWQTADPVCYLNCSYGFGAEQLLFHNQNIAFPPNLLLPIHQPTESGLYELNISYRNPHYRNPALFGIGYDAVQTEEHDTFPQILGLSSAEWANNKIFGGITGLPDGTGSVTISKADQPSASVTVPIQRGIFQTAGSSEWFTTIRNGAFIVSRPGTLIFEIRDSSGNTIREERHIGYGAFDGKHQFLFKFPCPGDFNGDGAVTEADVAAFFAAWEAGEPSADLNQDGGVDGDDVSAFFARWEAGSC